MKFSSPLKEGVFLQRYKRFFAEIQDIKTKEVYLAHCANSGKMLGLLVPGARSWISYDPNPQRKLRYTWELVESEGALVGVNTRLPNILAEEAIRRGVIPELKGYEEILREIRYGQNSRIDLLLRKQGEPDCYVEVKQVHLKREGVLEFPDCVTERGAKHLKELSSMVSMGARAVMLYVSQREDGDIFSLAEDLDPTYVQAAQEASRRGVEFLAYKSQVSPQGIEVCGSLSVNLFKK